jgi:type II secretory pathway pseudopilin PulG
MVELLIAMAIAGVIGTSIYFVNAGQSRVFFLQENIAHMQADLRHGMDLLKQDVKRAGYLATLSTQSDNWWCGPRPNPPITAIQATQGDGFVFNPGQNINITPDSLRLLGAFNANNTLYSSGVSGNVITLSNDPIFSPGFPATQAEFDRIFAVGTLLRILDTSNRYQLQQVTASSFGARTVTVLSMNRSTVQGCGPQGIGQGLMINPVEYVRYRVVDTSSAVNPACGDSPALTGRSTLVRENLAPDGVTVLTTMPVADYVIDFRVSFTVDTAAPGTQPNIAADLNPYDFIGNAPVAMVNANPQLVRSVGLFLAMRSPQEDPGFFFRPRQTTSLGGQPGLEPIQSFNLDGDVSSSCRVRSLSTEVQLRNFAYQN